MADVDKATRDFLALVAGHKNDPYLKVQQKHFDALVKAGKSEKALAAFVSAVAKHFTAAASQVLMADDFHELTPKSKADLVRTVLILAPKTAYAINAEASKTVYDALLKQKGVPHPIITPAIDEERLGGAVAGVIKHAIDDDGQAVSSLQGSFDQLGLTGYRDTIEYMGQLVEDKTSRRLTGERVVNSSNPCGYCEDAASQTFYITDGDDEIYHYHDTCSCSLSVNIE